ncbi:aldo/keto reductase [bacterium]|nr:MAG: aldo/keto reductase [bacterium]
MIAKESSLVVTGPKFIVPRHRRETGEGLTERIIGDWFASGGERRERTIIATKFYGGMGKDAQKDWPNTNGGSALNIRRACDASLQRLKTDYIDVYQMHHIDRSVPWEEIWEAYEVLKQQGKVLYFGSSNYAGWHIVQANEAAKRRNGLGLVSEQSKYSLLQRDIEMEVAPACEAYGVGIIPWSPLGSGALAGIMKGQGGQRRYGDWTKKLMEEKGDILTQWESLCEGLGEEPADVAIAWTLTRPFVTAPIIGPRTIEQLDSSARTPDIELSPETLAKIDELFPPFKTSPEHYAW